MCYKQVKVLHLGETYKLWIATLCLSLTFFSMIIVEIESPIMEYRSLIWNDFWQLLKIFCGEPRRISNNVFRKAHYIFVNEGNGLYMPLVQTLAAGICTLLVWRIPWILLLQDTLLMMDALMQVNNFLYFIFCICCTLLYSNYIHIITCFLLFSFVNERMYNVSYMMSLIAIITMSKFAFAAMKILLLL